MEAGVSFGGAERPFLMSLVPLAHDLQVDRDDQRRTLRVLRPVEQSRFMKSSSAACRPGTRRGFVFEATSSIEQIDMVDSVKGTPNFSAAAPP
jgi:hypothetical protein